MRRSVTRAVALLAVAAVLSRVGGAWRSLERRRAARSIRRLAEREACSIEDATRLYALARLHGYGAAHAAVFGDAREHAD